MYKLLAMDLDGTLIGNDLILSPRVRHAVSAARAQGITAILATGRMFRATLPFARELGITAPAICYQGAMIHSIIPCTMLFHEPVPLDLARETIRTAQDRGFAVLSYLNDWVYAGADSPEARFYARHSRVEPRFVGDLLQWLTYPPTKLVIVNENEDQTDENVAYFRHHFASKLNITKSYPLFTEIVHRDVSKGHALKELSHQLGIKQQEIIAIGDNLNDLDMIAYAGLGIAMGQSAPAVQQIAKWVAPPQHEDGVAAAIEHFLLN